MKKKNIILLIILVFIGLFLICYPFIEIDTGKKIYKFNYDGDVSKYENVSCYNESYFYYDEKDISIYDFKFSNFLFFHLTVMEYEKGNRCENEFLLEEEYINNFLNNAVIDYNENNIDVGKLIKGKTAVVSNTRYSGDDVVGSIDYTLDGVYETMYIFYAEELLIIRVGSVDEAPKYIAYK